MSIGEKDNIKSEEHFSRYGLQPEKEEDGREILSLIIAEGGSGGYERAEKIEIVRQRPERRPSIICRWVVVNFARAILAEQGNESVARLCTETAAARPKHAEREQLIRRRGG